MQYHDTHRLPLFLVKLLITITLIFFCIDAFANSGQDLLSGTDASLKATLKGTGKKYFYLLDGIIGLAVYIKTKNILLLFGSILVIAIFFEILLKFVG